MYCYCFYCNLFITLGALLTVFFSQEHVVANPQPSTEVNGHEIATPEPVVTPKSSSNTSPNASKPHITAPPPIAKPAKPVPRKEAK